MLEITNLSLTRDGKPVVKDVTLTVERGKITALLGANGAGKSELVLGVAGLMDPSAGRISVDGIDLTGKTPDFIRAAGVAAVPEGHQVLTQLSIEDNLRAAGSLLASDALQAELARVYTVFPELAERKRQLAGTMSGGQQQMLAIGHALMARPRYLLIDEMSLGLAPLIVKRLAAVVADLAAKGIGVLLVEQFVEVALSLATHVVVLRKGEVRLSVHPDEVRFDHEKLHQAYL
ncbi:MAG: ABC transporter ATP-binding protein [Rhodobacterales bacterium RIFCSPHIGHO2_02_FULL_62_130]|nr:MAG: ABC transporter ATP-binding protein [Burkholderiales bacterium RIFCSPHIGHO2_12_63_9]OHC58072.1 MAG: ABC transporter ATP-binding protein [Rhodobacterales bacterium RIFCSPHIGHO2_02_FULL_62_130]OHC60372.1 MAG: ABC transporter ATP-binding protein [Rhodobacterales bacterium RIFCSPHIGHO2_12_FULL_62_75]